MRSLHFHSDNHQQWVEKIFRGITDYCADQPVSLVVFGSWARGENRKNSDLDILVVSDRFRGVSRMKRHRDFVVCIEEPGDELGLRCYREDISTDISCVLLTREEARAFNPLYLDMSEHAVVVRDDDGFFAEVMTAVREKMRRWGTRKFSVGGRWGWEIQPGIKPGEVIDYDK